MTGTYFLGIDPGLKGGIAFRSESEGIHLQPMPVNDDGVDIKELARLLREFAPDIRVAYLEHVTAAPMKGRLQGTQSMFNFGCGFGIVRGVLGTLKIETVLVRPQTWMKVMHIRETAADTKERSRAAFRRYFPGVNVLATARSRVDHEGMIEAGLIAEYGLRIEKGII